MRSLVYLRAQAGKRQGRQKQSAVWLKGDRGVLGGAGNNSASTTYAGMLVCLTFVELRQFNLLRPSLLVCVEENQLGI